MTHMRGDLGETRLEDIFGELAASGSTGALHLEGGTGPAKVFFRDGEVYYASSPVPRAQLGARLVGAGFIDDDELDRALAAQEQGPTRTKLGAVLVDKGMVRRDVIRVFVQEQILDAVFDLARWDAGTIEFFRGDAVAEDLPVQIPTGPLLMEVRRRLSEWDDISAVIPSLDAVPDLVRDGSTTRAALEPDEFTLLTSVDGRRSVRDLAHDLGYSQFDAARLIYGLSRLGVVALSDGAAPTGSRSPAGDAATEPGTVTTGPSPEPPVAAAAAEPAPATDRSADPDEPEDDEVDIGRALEEALFGDPHDAAEEPGEEPDRGSGEVTAGTHHELDEDPTEDLEEVAREAARSTDDEPPPRDLSAGSDDLEPEIWSASIDADEDADGTPDVRSEEPVARPPAQPETHRGARDEAGPAPADDVDDDAADAREELMALVGELQEAASDEDEPEVGPAHAETVGDVPEVETADAETAGDEPEAVEPPQPRPEPAAQPDTPTEPEQPTQPQEQTSAAAAPDEPTERTERGDVSELLRELSRLAGGGPEPVAPTPDGQEGSDEPGDRAGSESEEPDEPQQADEPQPRSGDDDDDDDKRSTFRRLFGSR